MTSRQLRHDDQGELNGAVAVARWPTSGSDGQRVFVRKDPRVSPLVAAALALHNTNKPKRAGRFMSF